MAKDPRFDAEDIERLLKALVPSGIEDPFGRLEELLVRAAEEFEKTELVTLEYRKSTDNTLDSIKSRTFGILILQIFRTIKFFFAILPQGRLVLIVAALIGLLVTFMEDGKVDVGAIRRAAEATGLGGFLDKIVEEIKEITEEVGANASELADVASQVFVSIAGGGERVEEQLMAAVSRLQEIAEVDTNADPVEISIAVKRVASGLGDTLSKVSEVTNSASNSALVLGPALRAVDDRIREIPTLALKLVRLT